jgi:hypothetical protein
MRRPLVVIAVAATLAISAVLLVLLSRSPTTELAFWFEPISVEARSTLPVRLQGTVSAEDMRAIETISREEIVRAFEEYPVTVAGRTPALYHVRVTDGFDSKMGGSAESYVLPGMGGQGFVSFRSLAFGAVHYAPPDADRSQMIAAIGRGIGRAAVHEFTHQLLGRSAPIDSSTDTQSYEYGSTDRPEQYYGPMRWELAEPLLRRRFGRD